MRDRKGPEQPIFTETDIKGFIENTLVLERRERLIAALQDDRDLRNRIMDARHAMSDLEVTISERAAYLFHLASDALGHGNSFSPTARGLGGRERDPGIIQVREEWYTKARAAAQELLAAGELEDVAHEIIWRARTNRRNTEVTGRRFAKPHYEAAPEDAPHATIRQLVWPSEALPLSEALRNGGQGPAALSDFRRSLHQLFRSEKDSWSPYISHHEMGNELSSGTQELEATCVGTIRNSRTLISNLCAYLLSPIAGADPTRDVISKCAAARLLLGYAVPNRDTQVLNIVTGEYEALLLRNDSKGHTRFSADLVEGLSAVLAAQAKESPLLWQLLEPVYISALENNRFSIALSDHSDSFFTAQSVAALLAKYAPTEERSANKLLQLAEHDDPKIRRAAIEALDCLPPQRTAHLLLSALFPGAPTGSILDEDVLTESTIPGAAAATLAQYPINALRNVRLPEGTLPPEYGDATVVTVAAERALRVRIENYDFCTGYGTVDKPLVDILMRDDRARMEAIISHALDVWNERFVGSGTLCDILDTHNLRQFKPKLLGLLTAGKIASIDKQRVRDLLVKWGVPEEEIGRWYERL